MAVTEEVPLAQLWRESRANRGLRMEMFDDILVD
jgi:hypothetical protein